MKLRGIPCLESCGWITVLIGLAWTGSGFAQNQEKMILDGDYPAGHALQKVLPIGDLPKRIVFKPGEISLIADPSDHSGRYMVVYLVNDTDKPMTGVVGEMFDVRSEVRLGGCWFDREELEIGCGTFGKSGDLPPHNALALGGIRSDLGDTEGEIRYSFAGSDPKTEPMRGRYEADSLFRLRPLRDDMEDPLGTAIHDGLYKNDWSKSEVAHGPEEFCALLELARNQGQFLDERAALLDWLLEAAAKRDVKPEWRQAVDSIKTTLKKPWMVAGDGQALADRAISALESKRPGAYGTPEKCRAVIWRYLHPHQEISQLLSGLRPESKGMDAESTKRLASLAFEDLKSGDVNVGTAAASFLAESYLPPDLVPAEVFLTMLQSENVERNFAGLRGLVSRKLGAQAGPWVLGKVEAGHPRGMNFYSILRSRNGGEMKDWEKNVIRILLERKPLETVTIFRGEPNGSGKDEIPPECRNLFRQFLKAELLESRRKWWKDYSDRQRASRKGYEERQYVHGLGNAIRILDSWDASEDIELIRGFLDHPAAVSTSDTVFYSAREAAWVALLRRKVTIPENVIIREEIKPKKSE